MEVIDGVELDDEYYASLIVDEGLEYDVIDNWNFPNLSHPLDAVQHQHENLPRFRQNLDIPPTRRVAPKANTKDLTMAARIHNQPLPLEDHHVVLKEGSKQLTAATEIYGDYVQCIFGRVTCLSASQVRHIKALQDAYNCCRLGTDNHDPLPPVSFWVRKAKVEKQAIKKEKLNRWARDVEEVRYGFVQNKRVEFVQASDDCLRHDIRNSGDPIRSYRRQFKKLVKLFASVPDRAPSSFTRHVSRPLSCASSTTESASALSQSTSAPTITDSADQLSKARRKLVNSKEVAMKKAMSPCSAVESQICPRAATTCPNAKASQLSSPPRKAPPPQTQSHELFQIHRLANVNQSVNDICNKWLQGSIGVDRIIKEGLMKSFKEDVQHFQTQGLVDAITDMKVDVINAFGNNMVLCFERLAVKPLVGQKSTNKMFRLTGDENLESKALEVCQQLITNSSGMNRALRRGLVEAFKEDIRYFQSKGGLLAVDGSILVNVVNFFGNRMANYCEWECLDLSETLGMLSS